MLGYAWLCLAVLDCAWLCLAVLACFCKFKAALSVRLLLRFQGQGRSFSIKVRFRLFVLFLFIVLIVFGSILGASLVHCWCQNRVKIQLVLSDVY